MLNRQSCATCPTSPTYPFTPGAKYLARRNRFRNSPLLVHFYIWAFDGGASISMIISQTVPPMLLAAWGEDYLLLRL